MEELTKQQKYAERVRILMEKHGHKLNIPSTILDPEDRAGLGGGLKCFTMVFDRKPDGTKLDTKHRCGNPARKKSFFCKKHGGGNQHALTTGERSMIASAYRGVLKTDTGALFDAFLNDPTLLDLKPELSAMRTCLTEYLKKVSMNSKKVGSSRKALSMIRLILKDDMTAKDEKWERIKMFCSNQTVLTDGESLDRITRMIDTISKVVERIEKHTNKEEFQLSIDGLKIMYRCIIDIIRKRVPDEKTLKLVKEDLVQINTRTQGDVSKYQSSDQPEKDAYRML